MVSDWVKIIWKWSQIALKKNNFNQFWSVGKNRFFKMHFFTPSKKVGLNLKSYSERFLTEFYENGKQKLPSTIND